MKFSKGDKVALKGKEKEGRIVRYIGPNRVELALEDNTLIEAEEDNLEYPYLNWFRKESRKKSKDKIRKYTQQEPDFDQERKPNGILLGFWPEYFSSDFDDLIENIRVYFYNDSPDEIEFFYSYTDDVTELLEVKKRIAPFENFFLHSIPFSNLNDKPKISLKLSPKDEPLAEVPVHLKPKKLYEELNQLREHDLPAYYMELGQDIFSIYIPDIIDVSMLRPSTDKVAKPLVEQSRDTNQVIDLHLESLFPDDYTSVPKEEALGHQMTAFRDFLADAIKEKQTKITVVHGIGKGRLKEEIHKILDSHTFVKKYQNELHPLYGYGSTEIWLK